MVTHIPLVILYRVVQEGRQLMALVAVPILPVALALVAVADQLAREILTEAERRAVADMPLLNFLTPIRL